MKQVICRLPGVFSVSMIFADTPQVGDVLHCAIPSVVGIETWKVVGREMGGVKDSPTPAPTDVPLAVIILEQVECNA